MRELLVKYMRLVRQHEGGNLFMYAGKGMFTDGEMAILKECDADALLAQVAAQKAREDARQISFL